MKKFAFLIHPRDTSDVARRLWFSRFVPAKVVDATMERLKGRVGYSICSRFEVLGVEGYLLGIYLTGKQIMTLPRKMVLKRILEAILFAQDNLGVELIGLGELIASVTDGGKWIIRQPEVRVSITHGDAYAVAVAEEGIERIVDLCGFDQKETKIAVVGAYGLIGEALTRVLASKGYQLILVGRSRSRVERLKKEVGRSNNGVSASIELEDIYDADIVVTATSHPGTLIRPGHLKQGAVVYDIAQPMNVSPGLIKERPDIIKIDGAYVDIGGIKLGFDMGPPPKTTFACLVETMMETLEGENNHYVGEIDLLHVEKTKLWAEKYGFCHAPFSCFSRPVPLEHFQEISELRKNKAFLPGKT